VDGKCGEGFCCEFTAESAFKKFLKLAKICQSYERNYSGVFFDSQCIYEFWSLVAFVK